eukprot:365657-Chlamydomonas_euryale.AAC.2
MCVLQTIGEAAPGPGRVACRVSLVMVGHADPSVQTARQPDSCLYHISSRQTDRQTDTPARQTRQTDRQTDRHASQPDRQTDRHASQPDRQTRQPARQTDTPASQPDRQTRQPARQTDRHASQTDSATPYRYRAWHTSWARCSLCMAKLQALSFLSGSSANPPAAHALPPKKLYCAASRQDAVHQPLPDQ